MGTFQELKSDMQVEWKGFGDLYYVGMTQETTVCLKHGRVVPFCHTVRNLVARYTKPKSACHLCQVCIGPQ